MISVGDLVQCRNMGEKVGVVVDKKLPNENLTMSVHTKHLLNVYDYLYYVYFSELGKLGPYHVGEITLKQTLLSS